MNKVIMMGRLTNEPEVRWSQTERNVRTAIAKFNLAVDRTFKKEGQPTADFFNCVTFGKTAEFIEKYITKGSKILIEGSMQNNNWEKDGVKHYDMQVLVERVEFGESKANKEPSANTDADGFMTIPDGVDADLPFV